MEEQSEEIVPKTTTDSSRFNLKIFAPLFILLTIIIVLLILLLLKNNSTKQPLSQTSSSNPTSTPASTPSFAPSPTPTAKNQEAMLRITEYNVQVVLSDEIKDAYYVGSTASKGYVYLKVHSLDSEPQCLKDDSSTAALSRVGKDDVNPMSEKKYSETFKGTVIGNYFYYIDVAQYICAESTAGKEKLDKVRKAFFNATITQ